MKLVHINRFLFHIYSLVLPPGGIGWMNLGKNQKILTVISILTLLLSKCYVHNGWPFKIG